MAQWRDKFEQLLARISLQEAELMSDNQSLSRPLTPILCPTCRMIDVRSLLPRCRIFGDQSEEVVFGFRFPDGGIGELPKGDSFRDTYALGSLDDIFRRAMYCCSLCRLFKHFIEIHIPNATDVEVQKGTSCTVYAEGTASIDLKRSDVDKSKYNEADCKYNDFYNDACSLVRLSLYVQRTATGEMLLRSRHAFHLGRAHSHPFLASISSQIGASLLGLPRPTYLSIDIIRAWMRKCKSEHPCDIDKSGFLENASSLQVLRLVDVRDLSLTTFAVSEFRNGGVPKYCALSYTWGAKKQKLCLTRANAEELRMSEALQKSSQTILDAMRLVKQLRYRYLWVDVLCVVQDDEIDKALCISNMHAIFKASALNLLIMTDGGADAGIPGISYPRATQLSAIMSRGFNLLSTATQPIIGRDWLHSESSYRSRAWTLQEEWLSAKALIIMNDQLCWHCQHGFFIEDLDMLHLKSKVDWGVWNSKDISTYVPGRDEHQPFTTEVFTYRKSEKDQYANLIQQYTTRQVTLEYDMLNAITGLMDDIFPGNLYGIPRKCFEANLCWVGKFTNLECIRSGLGSKVDMYGEIRVRDLPSRRRGFDGPSWTWAAWKGPIDYESIWESSPKLVGTTAYVQAYNLRSSTSSSTTDRNRSLHLVADEGRSDSVDLSLKIQKTCYLKDVPGAVRLNSNHLVFWADAGKMWLEQVPTEDFQIPEWWVDKGKMRAEQVPTEDLQIPTSDTTYAYFAIFTSQEAARTLLTEPHLRAMAYGWSGLADSMVAMLRYHLWQKDDGIPDDSHQRAPVTGTVDFILMGESRSTIFMLVHYDEHGVAYRDSLHETQCSMEDWKNMNIPLERKLIVLG